MHSRDYSNYSLNLNPSRLGWGSFLYICMEEQNYSKEILNRIAIDGTIDVLSVRENSLLGYKVKDNRFVLADSSMRSIIALPEEPHYYIKTVEMNKVCLVSTRCLLGEEEVSLRILYYIPANKQYYYVFVTPAGQVYFEDYTTIPKTYEHQVTVITGISMETGFSELFSKIMTRLRSCPQLSCSVCLAKYLENGDLGISKEDYRQVFDSDSNFKDYLEDVIDDPTSLIYELNLKRL